MFSLNIIVNDGYIENITKDKNIEGKDVRDILNIFLIKAMSNTAKDKTINIDSDNIKDNILLHMFTEAIAKLLAVTNLEQELAENDTSEAL